MFFRALAPRDERSEAIDLKTLVALILLLSGDVKIIIGGSNVVLVFIPQVIRAFTDQIYPPTTSRDGE